MDQQAIAAAAARHHGVLSREMLEEHGVSNGQRRTRVARGEWRRLPNGVLVVAGVPESFEMRTAASLAAPPAAALSHQTAIRVHGSDVSDREIHLAVEAGGSTRSAGATVHQTTLHPRDVVTRRGFRVTTIERTLVDLGATMGSQQLQGCVEDHLVRRTTTFARLETTFVRLARPGRTGTARTRSVLAKVDGKPPSESELEAMFDRLLTRHRLPVPVRQVEFDWTDVERGRVDCWYPEARVIVELDGRRFHARLVAFERDRRRDQAALLQRIPTVRFTYHQIADEPAWVAKVLRSVLT